MTGEEIRADFATALERVNSGAALAAPLHWAFSDDDLFNLGWLHWKNKYREKIEDLLEDSNFHRECRLLHDGEYREYFKELIRN